MSSTIGQPPVPTTRGETGCALVVVGAALLVLANLLIGAALLASAGGYALALFLPMLWIIAGFLLAAAFGLGLVRRALAGDIPSVTLGLVAGLAAFVGLAHTTGQLAVPELETEWLVTLVTGSGALAAALVVEPGVRRPALLGALAVVASASLVSLQVATRLDVRIVSAPEVVRPGNVERLLFEADEPGDYEVWLGPGCGRGDRVADGPYGPAGTTQEVQLDTDGSDDIDRIQVCVRNGIAHGADAADVRIDSVPPAAATLEVEPTTDDGSGLEAATRALELHGTAPGDARVIVEISTAGGLVPIDVDVHDGTWVLQRTFPSVTDEFSVGVVTEDEAGLTARAPMLHVRFVGLDTPAVALGEHPGLAVECRGEPPLDADACRAWARSTIDLQPDLLDGAVRLLLAQPGPYGGCYAETRDDEGFVETGTVISCASEGA